MSKGVEIYKKCVIISNRYPKSPLIKDKSAVGKKINAKKCVAATMKGKNMSKMFIKEVSEFTEKDENNNVIRKSKLVISNNGIETEIILEGNGKIKVTTAV